MLRNSYPLLSIRFPSSIFSQTAPLLAESNRRRKHLARVHYGDEVNPLSKPTRLDKSTLYIVPTPIGNIKDFSLRALEVLRQVDYVFCINKVATQVLMDIIDINCSGRLLQYNKHARSQSRLAELVKGGASAALVCPQGTPIVGDQGVDVVQQFLKEGVRVSALPGPCAAVSALAMSGASGSEDAFFFGGHLSLVRGTRLRQFHEIAKMRCPVIFYEATQRLRASLEELSLICGGDRVVSVVHEISKIHEATHRDKVSKLALFYSKKDHRELENRGQVTLIVDADPAREEHGHKMFSAAYRNESQHLQKRNRAELEVTHLRSSSEDNTNNINPLAKSAQKKMMMMTPSESSTTNISFKDRALFRLVQDQLVQQGDETGEKLLQSVCVFVAKEMDVEPKIVWNAYSHVKRELVNKTYRESEKQQHQIPRREKTDQEAKKSGEDKDINQENDDDDDDDDDEYKEVLDLPEMIKFKNQQKQQKQQQFSLVRNDPLRTSTVEGDQHFPDDWIPEVAEEEEVKAEVNKESEQRHEEENETIKAAALEKEETSDSFATTKSSFEIEEDNNAAITKRRLEAKRKILKAIAAQRIKTKMAKRQLEEERMRDL